MTSLHVYFLSLLSTLFLPHVTKPLLSHTTFPSRRRSSFLACPSPWPHGRNRQCLCATYTALCTPLSILTKSSRLYQCRTCYTALVLALLWIKIGSFVRIDQSRVLWAGRSDPHCWMLLWKIFEWNNRGRVKDIEETVRLAFDLNHSDMHRWDRVTVC